MKLTKGNLALMDHLTHQKRVFLFQYDRPGYVKFEGELEFYEWDWQELTDIHGAKRMGIIFFLKRKGAHLQYSTQNADHQHVHDPGVPFESFRIPNRTERQGLITSRVGQGAYRKSILHHWNYECAVTRFNNPSILIASHIVPWVEATDIERLDKFNGILLSPVYDALFDRHLITFDQTGKIMLSHERIERDAFQLIGVTGNERLQKLSDRHLPYLARHRQQFDESEFTPT